jgi:c-di-GMP-related signal transduction protein
LTATTGEDFFLARQPILDRDENIAAYELLFRSGHANFADVTDDVRATSTVIMHAFSDMGLAETLGNARGFLNFSGDLLMSDVVELLPKEQVVIEILETVDITEDILRRCQELKWMGYTLALDDFAEWRPEHEPLMPLLSVVKAELPAFNNDELAKMVKRMREWPVQLLAEKVDNREQVQYCRDLGFDLFQGYYFAKPTIISGKQADMSSQTLLRVLAAVMKEADTTQIEAILKRDAGLTHKLLRLVNSAAVGLRYQIGSLQQAIVVLGRQQLQRWLELMLFVREGGTSSGAPSPLLIMAATRGRFMELLAKAMPAPVQTNPKNFEERAFLVGVTSLLDTVLSVPMEQIVLQLNLEPDIKGALIRREGVLGKTLSLTERLEQDDFAAVSDILPELPGVQLASVTNAQIEAMTWAAAVGEESPR